MGEKQTYELSHGQKRFWIQSQLDPNNSDLNQPVAVQIRQEVDTHYLHLALQNVIERHFILRTVFKTFQGEPRQIILEKLHLEAPLIDLSDYLPPEKKWEKMLKMMDIETNIPFNLEEGPLLRARIYKISDEDYVFYICMHHIIEDGLSMDIFFQELFLTYHSLRKGLTPNLPELPIQYIDYAHWQNQLVNKEKLKKQGLYWKEKMDGELPTLNLPLDFIRPVIRESSVAVEKIVLDAEIFIQLEQMNRKHGTTMFMSLVACLNIFLAKISNQDEFVVGTPIAGRNNKHVKNLIGFFVNTLVLRNKLTPEMSFTDFLYQVKENCIEAYTNQDYPFDKLLEDLNYHRELNRAPLFDVLINYASEYSGDIDFDGVKFNKFRINNGAESNEFDLTVNVEIINNQLEIQLNYQRDLFTENTMQRLTQNFKNIITSVAKNQMQKISEINYLSNEELAVINDINNTHVGYPNETIPSLFFKQVKRTPNAIGIHDNGLFVTYEELHQRSNQIGNLLRDYGVIPNQLVSVMVNRGAMLISTVLGVLKAGGAYVPIDPHYPEARIEYMLHDSSCHVLITDAYFLNKFKNLLPQSINTIICLDDTSAIKVMKRTPDNIFVDFIEKDISKSNMEAKPSSNDLAYVIYTSGSSGKPKGVMITHKAVLNTIFWMQEQFPLSITDVVAQKTSASFTDSVWEFFWPLLTGARLTIIPTDSVKDPANLYRSLKEERVTVTQFVPSLMNLFLNAVRSTEEDNPLPNLKWVFNGGEALPVNLVQDWYALFKSAKIANTYGMTESAIYATNYSIDDKPKNGELRIPIGRPISNTHVYVLNRFGNIAGFNIQGEICIGGIGITSGYWNQPELTDLAFTTHPVTGELLYRTGDLGSLRPDGILEYMGRTDDQVQVRGFRVEMKEVERAMVSNPAIKEAVVVSHMEKSGVTALSGYYTGKDKVLKPESVRENLKRIVPDYMLPAYLIQLEEFPLTPHGKIDRKNLPVIERRNLASTDYQPPKSLLEKELVSIWEDILEVDKVGVLDNFFSLGGQSLKMARVMYQIQLRLKVTVSFKELFEFQTIRELGKILEGKSSTYFSDIKPIENQEYYQVSSAQRRLFVLHQLEGDSMSNHISSAWIINGEVERSNIELIFRRLINRHEVFRTSFTLLEGNIVQKINQIEDWHIEYSNGSEENIPLEFQSFIRPFNLEKSPLLRVKLLRLKDKRHVLMIDVHHIIFDGISANLLINEFISLFNGKTIESTRIQYKDYAAWQNSLFEKRVFKDHEKFWLGEFDQNLTGKDIPLLNLPTDFPRPKQKTFSGGSLSLNLSKEHTSRIKDFVSENDVTLFMVIFAAYNVFLNKYTGQEDIVIGTPVAGRHHAQIEKMIGTFVNTLAIRINSSQKKNFRQFLEEVKEKTLKVLEYQDYPFDHLVSQLNLERDMSRNPLFDTMLRVQNFMEGEKNIQGLDVEPYPIDNGYIPVDLMLTVHDVPEGLNFIFNFNSELFQEESIHLMAKHFMELLLNLISQSDRLLFKVNMLTEEERDILVNTRNSTKVILPEERLFHQMFEDKAKKIPNDIAVVCGEVSLTYGELDVLSNRLARTLRSRGVGPNKVVAILIKRSVELITSILAVLKAGGAYLPIDNEYPEERITYMLNESDADLLLTNNDMIQNIEFNRSVIYLDSMHAYHQDGESLSPVNSTTDMAYMLFTSGSTGNPKGVMIGQESVTNFIYGITEKIPFNAGDSIFSLTTVTFDIFLLETLLPLTQGLKVVLSTTEEQKDFDALLSSIRKHNTKMIQITPSRLQLLLLHPDFKESLETVQVLMVGGEAFPESLLYELKEVSNSRIFNMYGPTETTVWSTIQEVTFKDKVTVGKPISNTQVYILDQYLNPVPDTVVGDLWISGKGLALGYHNRRELMNERFVQNPFRPDELMFKTGDLARWQHNKEIEILGRTDHQIKIRGYRVELGEIEHSLLSHKDIHEAVVIPVMENKNVSLCAYLVCHTNLTVKEIREYIMKKLPDFMIPSHFINLKEMPLTPNGKVNRNELPTPKENRPNLGVEYKAASSKVELEIKQIWEEVLNKKEIGLYDNFFDLGGNSLLLIQMNYRIKTNFSIQLFLSDSFSFPTIAKLAEFIEGQIDETRLWSLDERNRYDSQKSYWENKLVESHFLIPLMNGMKSNEAKASQTSFVINLPIKLTKTLNHHLESQSYNLIDLLLSVYMYALSQAINRKELVVSVGEEFSLKSSVNKGERLYPISANFSKTNDVSKLCIEILNQRKYAKQTDLYQIPKLPDLVQQNDKSIFYPCIIINSPSFERNMIRNFDWRLYLDVNEQNIKILCEYNGAKLKKAWIEHVMNGYIHLLQQLAVQL
ncbi:non-ribosomal peptide synthetase [Metabacillus idriensis]|uniref:non-ribosomal peptide synthetase n=1 Tax=Metabacillus idriensis TaxID=324768 RepID=UPI00174AE27A|nr:non-ribosomal peptide synthetase [Metabacillus idriensis]